ncbi:hypothetical protein KUV41_16880 [Halomonas sp. DP8Y7-1]|uniref:GapS6a family protein n=1 Tax=Halomonas sp. DP8Y7-1 TaxID=2859078 RepID=UPI001C98E4A1|nr:hypothetical protein [Halomonas sp. DP8Y7-1]MBY6031035.1 hypothetical protein [Halomonas sp. DP8Y7-1]
MLIESVAAGVVANLVYECTKKGVSLTKDFLVRELAKAVDDDQQKLEKIAEELIKLDQSEELEDLSEKGIRKRMEKYPELVKTLNNIKQENVKNITNQYHYGNGDNVGGDKYC